MLRPALLSLLLMSVSLPLPAAWYRGNTHTHTNESDGDSTPVEVARWYRDHGYDFLVITDHDKITSVSLDGLLIIRGEEVTDYLPKKPLHVNAIGLRQVVKPQKATTVVENLQRNIDSVRAAGGIAAINHPNFGWAFGAEELKRLHGVTLLEIASGHPYVNMAGPPSVESMWDALLTAGKRVWGIAVDDSHHLKRPWDSDIAPPGRAWIVVRSEKLDAEAILTALQCGDFYASNGVELDDYVAEPRRMTVKIHQKNLAHYRTQFIGPNGALLFETTANPAVYSHRGAARYIRARVIDSNGRQAWTQPWFRPEE